MYPIQEQGLTRNRKDVGHVADDSAKVLRTERWSFTETAEREAGGDCGGDIPMVPERNFIRSIDREAGCLGILSDGACQGLAPKLAATPQNIRMLDNDNDRLGHKSECSNRPREEAERQIRLRSRAATPRSTESPPQWKLKRAEAHAFGSAVPPVHHVNSGLRQGSTFPLLLQRTGSFSTPSLGSLSALLPPIVTVVSDPSLIHYSPQILHTAFPLPVPFLTETLVPP